MLPDLRLSASARTARDRPNIQQPDSTNVAAVESLADPGVASDLANASSTSATLCPWLVCPPLGGARPPLTRDPDVVRADRHGPIDPTEA